MFISPQLMITAMFFPPYRYMDNTHTVVYLVEVQGPRCFGMPVLNGRRMRRGLPDMSWKPCIILGAPLVLDLKTIKEQISYCG
jgi:hypothetical protein